MNLFLENENEGTKILVVEDDGIIGADIATTLTSFGYKVLGPLARGEDALAQFSTLHPDIVLMDIGLRGKIDGIQTAEEIQLIKATPIVFLTGLNDESILHRAKLTNPYGYLIKPFEDTELHSMIELTLYRFGNDKRDLPQHFESHIPHELTGVHWNHDLSDNLKSKASISKYLHELPIFKDITGKALETLIERSSIRQFEAGAFICSEGEPSGRGFIPLTGRVSITKTAYSGKDLIVALLAPGDTMGLLYNMTAFEGSTSARAQLASKIISVPKQEWDYLTQHEPILYRNICELMSNRLVASFALSSSLAHARVEGRIIRALLALLPDFGKSDGKVKNEERIYITRKELAELTGTTPETAIRVTKHLERENLLDLTRAGIIKIPNVPKLRDAANI